MMKIIKRNLAHPQYTDRNRRGLVWVEGRVGVRMGGGLGSDGVNREGVGMSTG